MNRKLLVNEQLDWPLLDTLENSNILKLLHNFIKLYPSLKRQNTLPKKIRKTQPLKEVHTSPLESTLKSRIRLGINSVTKELEKDPSNVKFVLVCRSCKPILTRHLYIMSCQAEIKAGCVQGLSDKVGKCLNFKTVSAFAILNCQKSDANDLEGQRILSELSCQLIKCLPVIKNPFGIHTTMDVSRIIKEEEELVNEVNNEDIIENVQVLQNQTEKYAGDIPMTVLEETASETFGSDFISVSMETDSPNWLPFNSDTNYIFFDDDYNDLRVCDELRADSKKRKFGNRYSGGGGSDIRLNPMSIRYRATDKNRQKVKSMSKEKSMKGLEQNKFGKKKGSAKNEKKS